MSRYAALVATGRYLPDIELPNSTLKERFSTSHPGLIEKFESSTGILTRWHASENMHTSDLAAEASQQALQKAGLASRDIDLIILGTDTPDFITPSTSVIMQDKIGAKNAGTFDVGCACASFPTAISIGAGMIQSYPSINRVLVVSAYLMHRLADSYDPTYFFYGDGAGAAILEVSDEPGVLQADFLADGSYARYWGIFSGGTVEPANEQAIKEGRTRVQMPKSYPPEVNNEGWLKLMQSLMHKNHFAPEDIELAVFTQVSRKTILDVANTLGLLSAKLPMIMDQWGYTGSACVPMALDYALEQKLARAGDLITLVGSGVGYNQAAVAIRLTHNFRM